MTQQINIADDFISQDVLLDLRLYGKYVAFLRRQPIHAIRVMWGILIPPHESYMIRTAWMDYRTNIYTCSRGTSKSFTIGSLFSPTKALLYRNKAILIASASRFRGGKFILKDSSNLLSGSLKSQKVGNNWGAFSLAHRPSYIKKDPDMWYQEFKSNSTLYTIPTNNEESVRGMRANILIIDERDNFEGEVIQKVYMPFLNVGSDFENTATGSESNQVFHIGTITYTYKDWYKEIIAAQDLAKLQYETQKNLQTGNWAGYDYLMKEHGKRIKDASVALVRFDYTDLIIPTILNGYKINYPGAKQGKHIKYDLRDECEYIYTYPVTKTQLEDPLYEGIIDEDTWWAEQRNMFIKADGNVYSYDLIEKVTGPIFTNAEEEKKGWDAEVEGHRYLPPVLYNCSDPCILGVDTARLSDFSAFVIIRMGDINDAFFTTPRPHYDIKENHGPSAWSNVIWAEQHQQMMVKEVAEKIRELRTRYNIVATRHCPGVIMDARGGGINVRDELVIPSPPLDENGNVIPGWSKPQRIFDPDDKDERFGKELLVDGNAWFGLKMLFTDDPLNQELVNFSKAQMQSGKLFIASGKSKRAIRTVTNKMYAGTVGVEVLKTQLLRIQAIPGPGGRTVKYVMPGDAARPENKRDMLFAFLYACYGLKEWNAQQGRTLKNVPIAYGEIVKIGKW